MILFHSFLAALCLLCAFGQMTRNVTLAIMSAVCCGINIAMVINYASGVM